MIAVLLLLLAPGVDTPGAAGQAKDAEEAVTRYIAATQKDDGKQAIALWPDAVRQAGEVLIPLGRATRQAKEDLEAAMLEKFGGKKGDHRIDPGDLLPVLDYPGINPGVKIEKVEIAKVMKVDENSSTVLVRLTASAGGKSATDEVPFDAVREESGWKVVAEKNLLRLKLPGNVERVKEFSTKARALLERTAKEVREGKLATHKEVTKALEAGGPILRIEDLPEKAEEKKPEEARPEEKKPVEKPVEKKPEEKKGEKD